uniref:Uncharacterized protein n=1 Tax=Pararge aegeria TaxID=116150 RepID=S4NXE4_9NEOP
MTRRRRSPVLSSPPPGRPRCTNIYWRAEAPSAPRGVDSCAVRARGRGLQPPRARVPVSCKYSRLVCECT